MYSGIPLRQRLVVQGSLVIAWTLIALGGLSAITASPNTITAELGWIIWLSGVVLIAASVTAAVGVITGRYVLEWLASWVGAAATAPYLVTVWALTFTDTWTRSMQAFLVSALVAFLVNRGTLCAAHAAKLREIHSAGTATLRTVENHEEGQGDAPHGNGGG